MSNLIEVEHLTVSYGRIPVVRDVSFKIETQDYLAIVGPNGSGKTTCMKALLKLIEPDAGRILFDASVQADDIGYLPQRTTFQDKHFPASVKEVILTGVTRSMKLSRKEVEARIAQLASQLDIEALLNKRVGYLSGGQQQRVMLARALIKHPKVLILDEPTSALDPQIREEFYQLIQTLHHQQGVSVVLISHDLQSVSDYAKHILYLDEKVVYFGPSSDLCTSEELMLQIGPEATRALCKVPHHEHRHPH
jgi:zinc transport system ATP-binding protein